MSEKEVLTPEHALRVLLGRAVDANREYILPTNHEAYLVLKKAIANPAVAELVLMAKDAVVRYPDLLGLECALEPFVGVAA